MYIILIFLPLENPFVEAVTPSAVTVVEGDSLSLRFRIAVNSNGNSWDTSRTEFNFMNSLNESSTPPFTNSIAEFPQDYLLEIAEVSRLHEGTYLAYINPGKY